jgi:hypothetical protein
VTPPRRPHDLHRDRPEAAFPLATTAPYEPELTHTFRLTAEQNRRSTIRDQRDTRNVAQLRSEACAERETTAKFRPIFRNGFTLGA